jgi:hypothetical protein
MSSVGTVSLPLATLRTNALASRSSQMLCHVAATPASASVTRMALHAPQPGRQYTSTVVASALMPTGTRTSNRWLPSTTKTVATALQPSAGLFARLESSRHPTGFPPRWW